MDIIKSNRPVSGAVESRQGGRAENQDDYGYCDVPMGFLAVVCDGMGGGPGGKTASYIAKMAIMETIYRAAQPTPEELLKEAITNACIAVNRKTEEVPTLRGMGSTAVILLVTERTAYVCHVGDSRAYKIKGNSMVFRTNDHSMVGQMVRNGTLTEEQARLSSQSNIITQAIGSAGPVEPEIDAVPYEKGDRFFLCSDGIWGAMPEPELVKKFAQKKAPGLLAESLAIEVDTIGNANGGHHDNLTLAIVETSRDSKLKEKMSRKAKQIVMALCALCVISVIGNFILSMKLSHRKDLRENYNELAIMYNSQSKNVDSINTKLHDSNSANSSKDEQIAQLNKTNITLGDSIVKLNARVGHLNNQISSLNQQLATVKTTASQTQTTKPQNSQAPQKQNYKQLVNAAIGNLELFKKSQGPGSKSNAINSLKKALAAAPEGTNLKKQLGLALGAVQNSKKYDEITEHIKRLREYNR